MKKVVVGLLFLFSIFSIFGCNSEAQKNVVRIHIRGNSNTEIDQSIKLEVRDGVIDFITPIIADCKDSNDVKEVLNGNLSDIECIADEILENSGFKYLSNARICNEYFPTRSYNGEVFPADYYDALILDLGSGKGDNWWCVAYPPLCFVGKNNSSTNVEYKSKLMELINNYFGG